MRTSSDIWASTSRRTAFPKRRRRSSISTATMRSSASSSSTIRSALRVTLKAYWRSISIPRNRAGRWAAMTCSRGTKRSPSAITTNRGRMGGTFTRANLRSPLVALRTITARFRERLEMSGKGWAGSTERGVSTGKIHCWKTWTR